MNHPVDPQLQILISWRRRAIRASNAHYVASGFYRVMGTLFTCFNLLSAIAVLFLTNNSILMDIDSRYSQFNLGVYTAVAGLLVVLSTALQYVLKFEVKSRDSKSAGHDFTNIKREIEMMLATKQGDTVSLDRISTAHTHIARNHDLVMKPLWWFAERQTRAAIVADTDFENSVKRAWQEQNTS